METKQIEDTREAEKVREARAALRGATKHAETLIKHNDAMAKVMGQQAAFLRQLAEKSGDVFVNAYCPNAGKFVPTNLKRALQDAAHTLQNGAIT